MKLTYKKYTHMQLYAHAQYNNIQNETAVLGDICLIWSGQFYSSIH